jgi:transposase
MLDKTLTPPTKPPSLRTLTWLILRRAEQLTPEEQTYVAQTRQAHPDLEQAVTLAQAFATIVRTRRADTFDDWLERAKKSGLASFRGFAKGLRQDEAAVRAGLTLPWSQGPVEGHINRLKLLKRQSYGRAGLDLLRIRLLAA